LHFVITGGPPYPRFGAARKQNWKMKETVHKFQNARQARTGRNMVKSSSPNAPSTWTHLPLCPYPRFPANLSPFCF